MTQAISQSMYSVPITRRVGSVESIIPEMYRSRTHASWQEHVRCALFPGENVVKVTWNGTDDAQLIYQREDGKVSQTIGHIPANSGGGVLARGCSVSPRSQPRTMCTSNSLQSDERATPRLAPSQSSGWTATSSHGGSINEHPTDVRAGFCLQRGEIPTRPSIEQCRHPRGYVGDDCLHDFPRGGNHHREHVHPGFMAASGQDARKPGENANSGDNRTPEYEDRSQHECQASIAHGHAAHAIADTAGVRGHNHLTRVGVVA